MSDLPGLYNDWVAVFLMMTGFYIVISQGNLVKKIVGLNLFQASVFILYISLGKVVDGTINDPSDEDSGWSVEIALPWAAVERTLPAPASTRPMAASRRTTSRRRTWPTTKA